MIEPIPCIRGILGLIPKKIFPQKLQSWQVLKVTQEKVADLERKFSVGSVTCLGAANKVIVIQKV